MFRCGTETSAFEVIGETCGKSTQPIVRETTGFYHLIVEDHALEFDVGIESFRNLVFGLNTAMDGERLLMFPGHTSDTEERNDIEFTVGVVFREEIYQSHHKVDVHVHIMHV